VETEKTSWKDETMKELEVIEGYNKFMRSMDTADKMVHYYTCCRKKHEMDQEIPVVFDAVGCFRQFHI
jgi:hypothetical protein